MKKLKVSTKKQLKPYWKKLKDLEDKFFSEVQSLEKEMQEGVGIKDLEFINIDGYCGIGNVARTIKLIHSYELE